MTSARNYGDPNALAEALIAIDQIQGSLETLSARLTLTSAP